MGSLQAVEKACPARPQRVKRRIVHSYPPTPSLPRQALVPWPYGEPLRFTTRGITRVTFVNAAETVRRQCLARTPLADFFRILLLIHLPREVRYGEGHAAEKGDEEEAGEDDDGETR